MSNVLSEEKKQQVIALGKLGWTLRRIEEATGVRRETASGYLKAAGVVVCLPGWGRRAPAKPAIQVTTDFYAAFSQNSEPPKSLKSSPSTCEPYREQVELGLRLGRNAMAIWQDLVSDHGFAGGYEEVKRLVRKLRGPCLLPYKLPAGTVPLVDHRRLTLDAGCGACAGQVELLAVSNN